MIVLTAAVVLPMIQKAGFDLIWFGIFIVLLVEIAEVTPPVGFNLFVLQNMTGKDSNTIARAAIPFFVCLVVCIALITVFPAIVTWLPDAVMGVAALASGARGEGRICVHSGRAFRRIRRRDRRRSARRPLAARARWWRRLRRPEEPSMADMLAPLNWDMPAPGARRRRRATPPRAGQGQGQPRGLHVADAAVRQLPGADRADRDRCPARSSTGAELQGRPRRA